jgi:hypothetical protein
MKCSRISHSAWTQSFKAVPWQHPPTPQSSRARRSICSWTTRCFSAEKTTIPFLSDLLYELFFMGHLMRLVENAAHVSARENRSLLLKWLEA